ncbi:MAG: hypothetical protein DRN61_06345 [Thaumarchaeota archaeon]|nr:MAG: hypothetical protein DRN54_04715 [Nitrososphaerota archaeon]RLG02517.1 MAG: hypothetical protein DRN61_06345 [Nitrososphaerota archaeon]HDD42730.1 hypothetical protein [Nitrososphaeria archaeon]
MRWLHLIGEKRDKRHDVWASEIRIKLRGRRKPVLLKLIHDKLPPRFRERFREHLGAVMAG